MLVLSRKSGESLILRDRQTGRKVGEIMIVEVHGRRAKLSIDLPDSVRVLRAEIDVDPTEPTPC